jgi:hypothetical protein
MSEAEVHVIRARLRGGLLNKARRGELRCALPVGVVHDGEGRVVLDAQAGIGFPAFCYRGPIDVGPSWSAHFRAPGSSRSG